MKIDFNLVLVVVALWLLAAMYDGCLNRPKPFQDWMRRRQQRIDDRWKQPPPIDDQEQEQEGRRRQRLRDYEPLT